MRSDPSELLELAVEVAQSAGSLLLNKRPAEIAVTATKSSPTDIVTDMDRASEALITSALKAARPDDGLLGEEGTAEQGRSGVRWLIDPIDGTVNYLYGIPAWSVSIAAEVDGQVVAGVVHVPPLAETFTATRGGGAQLDGAPIRANQPVPLDQALVATGFGYASARRAKQAEVVRGLLPRVRDIRRAGSCAIDLSWVASGRVDAYYERGPQPWDLAAGVLIAREAGAVVAGLHGRPPSTELTIAAPRGLFEQLHDLLAAAGADRD
ncbi:MAG TPA: inositol monophosphatase family protein [Actinomycetes bacterium]|nr:inositol monophosphatase family protein [Actinomycetes bacterium]